MNRFPFPPYHSGIPHWSERVVTYCAKVLPLVFDNSLSYYEFLGHVQSKLNQVIEALNNQNLVFVEFTHMIELELQNFEKYMDERQTNFEQQIQDEWTAFKSEMETAWNDFKTQLEAEWEDEKELNAQFRTDMQAAFTQFQTTIQERQTAFETALRNQQNQFQTDMTSRQNTFEDTMEGNFEQWKVDTLAALQAGIQQFETDALAAIRTELPAMILDAVDDEAIEPMVQAEVARQGFAKILSASNETEGDAIDLSNEYVSLYRDGIRSVVDATLSQFTSWSVSKDCVIVFTSQTLWEKVGKIRAAVSNSAFPASGWRLEIGKYTTQQAISTEFNPANFTPLVSSPLSNDSTVYYANSGAGVDAGRGYYQYVAIRFTRVDTSAVAQFSCNYTQGIQLFQAGTADLVMQSGFTGNKYLIKKDEVRSYIITLQASGIVISSLPFTPPSGGNAYIHTWSFHAVKTLTTSIPDGYYIGATVYGTIAIHITNNQLRAAGVLTDYSGSQLTIGSSHGATFGDLRIYKIT